MRNLNLLLATLCGLLALLFVNLKFDGVALLLLFSANPESFVVCVHRQQCTLWRKVMQLPAQNRKAVI